MEKLGIKKVELLNWMFPPQRKVVVTLSNKRQITIVACHESFEQYGGTPDELKLTVGIAEYFVGWLHGEDAALWWNKEIRVI